MIIYLRVPTSVAMRSLFVFPFDGESGTFFFFFFMTLFFHFEPVLPAGHAALLLLGMFCSRCVFFSRAN